MTIFDTDGVLPLFLPIHVAFVHGGCFVSAHVIEPFFISHLSATFKSGICAVMCAFAGAFCKFGRETNQRAANTEQGWNRDILCSLDPFWQTCYKTKQREYAEPRNNTRGKTVWEQF